MWREKHFQFFHIVLVAFYLEVQYQRVLIEFRDIVMDNMLFIINQCQVWLSSLFPAKINIKLF